MPFYHISLSENVLKFLSIKIIHNLFNFFHYNSNLVYSYDAVNALIQSGTDLSQSPEGTNLLRGFSNLIEHPIVIPPASMIFLVDNRDFSILTATKPLNYILQTVQCTVHISGTLQY